MEIIFTEGNTQSLETALNEKMQSPIEHFEKELAVIRTGKASSTLVENVMVECYGQSMPIRELATIATPDARLITIQPWDKSIINAIEKGLLASNTGLTPINDGELIRLQLPQMSSERRDELVKTLNQKAEDSRIGIRNVRKEYHNAIRDAEKNHDVSEDFAKRLSDVLQKSTDKFIKLVDAKQEKKTSELKHV